MTSEEWSEIILEAVCGRKPSPWFEKTLLRLWPIPVCLSVIAVIAGMVSYVAKTNVVALIITATISTMATGAAATKAITYPIRFGYILEANFFIWLAILLPILTASLLLSFRLLGKAFFSLGDGSQAKLIIKKAQPGRDYILGRLIRSMTLWRAKNGKCRIRAFVMLLFLVAPFFSIAFQELALMRAIQLPQKKSESKFVADFDYGNTQAPTLSFLSRRFNELSSESLKWDALKDRGEQMVAFEALIYKSLTADKIPMQHTVRETFDLNAAVGDMGPNNKETVKFAMSAWPPPEAYDSDLSHFAFIVYLCLAYGLQGVGWSVSIFAAYFLLVQVVMWTRLIGGKDQEFYVELKFLDQDKGFGLEDIKPTINVIYYQMIAGASYLLCQCVSPEGWKGINDNGKGGTMEFRAFNISLVVVAIAMCVYLVVSIVLLTEKLRKQRLLDSTLTDAERNLIGKQQFFTFADALKAKPTFWFIMALAFPFVLAFNKPVYEHWGTAKHWWQDTNARLAGLI